MATYYTEKCGETSVTVTMKQEPNTILYKDLPSGRWFKWNGKLLLKTGITVHIGPDSNRPYYAVTVAGTAKVLEPQTPVMEVMGEIHIELNE
jgi:hypothetical protein